MGVAREYYGLGAKYYGLGAGVAQVRGGGNTG